MHETVNPLMFGYEKTIDGTYIVSAQLLGQPISAPELLTVLVCDCAEYSCDSDCKFLGNNQPCTADCSCNAVLYEDAAEEYAHCLNPMTYEHLENESDEEINKPNI